MAYEPGDWRKMLAEQNPGPGPAPPPAPRPARYRHLSWVTRLLVILSFASALPIIVPCVVALVLLPGPWDDWILDARGETAEGVVTKWDASETVGHHRGPKGDGKVKLSIDFRDERGKRRSTLVLHHAVVENDETVEIEYDPENIERARLAGESIAYFGYGAFGLIAVALAGFGAMVLVFRRAWAELILYRYGTAAQARVKKVSRSSSREGNRSLMIAHYEYDTPQGVQKGSHRALDLPGPGGALWVIYDPKQPHRSLAAQGE